MPLLVGFVYLCNWVDAEEPGVFTGSPTPIVGIPTGPSEEGLLLVEDPGEDIFVLPPSEEPILPGDDQILLEELPSMEVSLGLNDLTSTLNSANATLCFAEVYRSPTSNYNLNTQDIVLSLPDYVAQQGPCCFTQAPGPTFLTSSGNQVPGQLFCTNISVPMTINRLTKDGNVPTVRRTRDVAILFLLYKLVPCRRRR